jgi:gamma-glutamylcyclotransferase (GGCT)/AIG2-like uncharacterized protein YtfP
MSEDYNASIWDLGVAEEYLVDYIDDLREWVHNSCDRGYYSPDLPTLNRYTHHDVFIYGSNKKNMGRPWLVRKGTPLGVGYTLSDKFVMYSETRDNPEAVILPSGTPSLCASVYGELYRITTEQLLRLDFNMSNRSQFMRIKQTIRVKRGNQYVNYMCWIYVGNRSYWGDKINNADNSHKRLSLCEITSVNIGNRLIPYYNFQHKYTKKH